MRGTDSSTIKLYEHVTRALKRMRTQNDSSIAIGILYSRLFDGERANLVPF